MRKGWGKVGKKLRKSWEIVREKLEKSWEKVEKSWKKIEEKKVGKKFKKKTLHGHILQNPALN